jgi:tRNA uridine 5-carboxymethylaminomethyl modification enzyme
MTTRGTFFASYDVIVIGAGHAGCEAALAASRAGCTTLVLTPNLDRIGYMPCNPSIGGPGKAHLVAEVDALGGEMARAADRAALQIRRLNTSKGPAVQALRAQADKLLYATAMKESLETQASLHLRQDEAIGLALDRASSDRPQVTGVLTRASGTIGARTVVVTAGTFLRARMISGTASHAGGRAGDRADTDFAGSLADLGFNLRRLKTGTPPRISVRSVDFTRTEEQPGSELPLWFSRDGALGRLQSLSLPPLAVHRQSGAADAWRPQLACFRIETNARTHEVIRANLDRAPMFNGAIEGIGPRYCPSIEDKVARFGDKPAHPIFLEPEGWRTTELYVQGMSTSLPVDAQDTALRTIPALRDVHVTRFGYAVEYDAVDPVELTPSLEARRVAGLFLAGQVNGTSGYEEAAGQGILAGLNAANAVSDRAPVVLARDQAYIGVMIDDLVSKPFDEPYRMLTSRAEYRLLLRPDTAERRLTPIAFEHGLVPADRLAEVASETVAIERTLTELSSRWFAPNDRHAEILRAVGLEPVSRSMTALDLLRRPAAGAVAVLAALALLDGDTVPAPPLPPHVVDQLDTAAKYGAFIDKESRQASRGRDLDRRPIPPQLDYHGLVGLRIEAREKLTRHRPATFGQASRLSGVTPADVGVLLVHVAREDAATR